MRPLIISGAGRSGTAYVATVLSAAGYHCGHERVINIDRVGDLHPHHIEASGAAVPFLHRWPEAIVCHQFRHPLKVAASALARGFPESRSGRWTVEHCPSIDQEPTRLEAALRYWHDWNRMVEEHRNAGGWQVEELFTFHLVTALRFAEREPDEARIARALALVPKDLNRQHENLRTLTWDDVPEGAAKHDAMTLAKEYGYDD